MWTPPQFTYGFASSAQRLQYCRSSITHGRAKFGISMRGARRDVKAAGAFLKQVCENARLYQPRTIITDKAHSDARVIDKMNRFELPGEEFQHVKSK